MKTSKLAAIALLSILAAGSALAQTATPPSSGTMPQTTQTQRPMRPDRAVEITEVKPGVWVNGTPRKPIFSGDMPIYPEAYDNMPAKLP